MADKHNIDVFFFAFIFLHFGQLLLGYFGHFIRSTFFQVFGFLQISTTTEEKKTH